MYRNDEMAGSGLWRAASVRRAGLQPLIRRDDG
jgi:hypothetical protein